MTIIEEPVTTALHLQPRIFDSKTQRVYLEFQGVNSSAEVELNGQKVMSHDGGYSTFRADVTEFLTKENKLEVAVDNSVNDRVYPQKSRFHILWWNLQRCSSSYCIK